MIKVTPEAEQKIKEFLEKNKIDSDIRVTVMEAGCSGAALGIILDEATEEDRLFSHQGINFLIHKDLLEETGNITIDFVEPDRSEEGGCACNSGARFVVTSDRPVSPASGCSCGA